LTFEEQALVAMECVMMEFGAGEVVDLENIDFKDLGRGIFVLRRGVAFGFEYNSKNRFKYVLLTGGMSFGSSKVLVEDGHSRVKARLKFLTFAKVTFIPRKAILAALGKNEKSWKDCGRWRYLRAVIMSVTEKHVQVFNKPLAVSNLDTPIMTKPTETTEYIADSLQSE